jgi:hypothetical protein
MTSRPAFPSCSRSVSERAWRAAAVVTVGFAAVAGLAACSKSDTPSATPPSSTTSTTSGAAGRVNVSAAPENNQFCSGYADVTKSVLAAGTETDSSRQSDQMAKVKSTYASLVNEAPDAIKADVQTANDAMSQINSPADVLTLSGPARDASDRVTAWVASNCGFDPANLGN